MRICISGCSGRVGKELLTAVLMQDGLKLSGALVQEGSSGDGVDIGKANGLASIGINGTSAIVMGIKDSDAVIDFSRPEFSMNVARACLAQKTPLVIGTTGFSIEEMKELQEIAKYIPIFLSYNMAFSVTVLAESASKMAKLLGPDYDIEIIESHHNQKVDSPSGTALMVGRAIAAAIGANEDAFAFEREGKRVKGSIGFASVRAGGIVADIEVLFASDSEILRLSSSVISRNVFAIGALNVAKQITKMIPGKIYGFKDLYSF